GVSGSTVLTVSAPALSITTAALPSGIVNLGYSATLTAVGGTAPYSWSIASGALPAGLALNGSSGVISGTPTTAGTFNFTVQVSDSSASAQSATKAFSITTTTVPKVPILVLTNSSNPFTVYYSEILLAEGLNAFEMRNITSVSSSVLAQYDVVLLGQMGLNSSQVTMLSNWVDAGGKLIAMRPDKQLAGLLGLTDTGTTLSEGYLLVNSGSTPGAGIVAQTIQYHGTADRYNLLSASALATLYSSAQTATANPAVTLRSVGANGGQAAAFTYDLARSVVFTRQGNPAWAGQERDGFPPIRSDDLFYGPASFDPQPNWIDLNKVAIPQADEQQRLLANLILYVAATQNLLPRFWYFPNSHKAVVVMTGDDHAHGGTVGRFNQYISLSPPNGSVDDWQTIRSSSYIYPYQAMTDAQAASYNAAGFEIGLHLNTGCANFTRQTLDAMFGQQLRDWKALYPSLPSPTTHRTHCIAWSDYTSMAEVERSYGIRLDVNYYYWPPGWVANRPGFFTGSGMAMRFATAQGSLLDIYQAATQMTDESNQSYPFTINTLLDRALGAEGYYGAFVANMHTDVATIPESDAIVSSAMNRGVPVISARQLLTWLDTRNASTIQGLTWSNNRQTFSVQTSARGLRAMVPLPTGYSVSGVRYNGNAQQYTVEVIKGIQYVIFTARTGNYEVSFAASGQ
ncbi:MAG TPA: Ig domain-containing protein, partial [Clostridia bacterium]|nr:Ig domain-containing protein [Clostridia bacterium]